jgi:hypothetical protein
MTIWKSSIKSYITIIAWLCFSLSVDVTAQTVSPLELKPGLWEGIDSTTFHYNILELNADGNHRFLNTSIITAFKKGNVLNFTDEEIVCSSSECIINITKANDEITRLIISPYLGTSFKVLEISVDSVGRAIYTEMYQLDLTLKKSNVANFIFKYRKKIELLENIKHDGIYGFWLGILVKDHKPELIVFEVHPDKKSHFTLFISGENFVNETSFSPEKLTVNQDVIYIDTEHPTFANKLIINQLSHNQLSGYMYSVRKGQTLETGKFSLMRMR